MKILAGYKNVPSNFRRYVADVQGTPTANRDVYGAHGSYQAQLFDERWKKVRKSVLERDGYRCQNCGNKRNLEVHHRQYHYITSKNAFKEPWDYSPDLMVTLCTTCNQRGRNKYQIPTKIV